MNRKFNKKQCIKNIKYKKPHYIIIAFSLIIVLLGVIFWSKNIVTIFSAIVVCLFQNYKRKGFFSRVSKHKQEDLIESISKLDMGNTNGNIINGALFAEDNCYLYFQNVNDNCYLYKYNKLTNESTKINSDSACCINIYKNNLYYINSTDNKFCCTERNGLNRKELSNDGPSNVIIHNDFAYYINCNDSISYLDLNNGIKGYLTNDKVDCLNIFDKWAYYCNHNDSDKIYRIDLKLGKKEKICEESTEYLLVEKGNIYYISHENGFGICSMSLTGENKHKLINDECISMNVIANTIYYANNYHGEPKLYSVDTSGNNRRELCSKKTININVVYNGVYFWNDKEEYSLNFN